MSLLAVSVRSMSYSGQKASDGAALISDLTLDVEEGQFVSVLGPSGCGKTTLLRIIAGLERSFDGGVLLSGRPVERASRAIQVVFQDGRLLPWKSLHGNLTFAAPKTDPGAIDARISDVLGKVGLLDRQQAWPATLSGGEETRAALARALLWMPKVLLLDEPFRNLDFVTRTLVQDALYDLVSENGTAVVQVSHSIEDAVFLSDVVHCFAARPMRRTARFVLDVPQPRARSDARLAEFERQILAHMSKGVDGGGRCTSSGSGGDGNA